MSTTCKHSGSSSCGKWSRCEYPDCVLPSITCPVCGMTSYHPTDVEMGYCGNCHGYTSPVNPLMTAMRVVQDAQKDKR